MDHRLVAIADFNPLTSRLVAISETRLIGALVACNSSPAIPA
jgi:hypothetical protein